MGDDPAFRLLHRSCPLASDPSQRTAFPGDFAEFLSRSPTLSGSNCPTRHPALNRSILQTSVLLLYKVWRSLEDDPTSRLSHHTGHTRGSALHRTALPGDFAEFLSRPTSTEGRLCGSGEAGLATTDVVDGSMDLKGSENKIHSAENTEIRLGISTHAGCLRTLWQFSHGRTTL